MILAMTGGTGFVGRALVSRSLAAGHAVRALTRRAQPAREGVAWVEGALDDDDALALLVAGSDAAIHVAGATSAPTRAAFDAANVAGTAAMIAAAEAAGVARFVHVSSLSAREPQLSDYGASKAAAEALVAASALSWATVRPAVIYGPGELLDLFRMAARGVVLLPPAGRASIVGVDDLADLLIALADRHAPAGVVYDPDDQRPDGWDHRELAHALGAAVERQVRAVPMPRWSMALVSLADRAVRGKHALLTRDRVGYLCHSDWTADPANRPPATLWTPRTATAEGLAASAAWYRGQGLL